MAAGAALPLAPGQVLAQGQAPRPSDNRLWYRQPATLWEEALPVGNGRLGAMVFGNVNGVALADDRFLQLQGALPLLVVALPMLVSLRHLASGREFLYRYEDVPPHVRRIAERERQRVELETARRIQSSILPELPPSLNGVEIAHAYLPASEVGGDFYDVILLDMNFNEDVSSGREGFFWLDSILDEDPSAVVASAFHGKQAVMRRNGITAAN